MSTTTTTHQSFGATPPDNTADPDRDIESTAITSTTGADKTEPAFTADRGLEIELAAVTADIWRASSPRPGWS
ncbi:hypothetical protein [Kitasatospora sp. NPDC086791]|uniref:hypothetical protein n=1 Tax=Kitasatospora sp. NPDC086791 TaxID=3155178 RepID=UPI0034458D5F